MLDNVYMHNLNMLWLWRFPFGTKLGLAADTWQADDDLWIERRLEHTRQPSKPFTVSNSDTETQSSWSRDSVSWSCISDAIDCFFLVVHTWVPFSAVCQKVVVTASQRSMERNAGKKARSWRRSCHLEDLCKLLASRQDVKNAKALVLNSRKNPLEAFEELALPCGNGSIMIDPQE